MSEKEIDIENLIDFDQLDKEVKEMLDSKKKNAVSLLRKYFMEVIEDVSEGRSPEY